MGGVVRWGVGELGEEIEEWKMENGERWGRLSRRLACGVGGNFLDKENRL